MSPPALVHADFCFRSHGLHRPLPDATVQHTPAEGFDHMVDLVIITSAAMDAACPED